MLLNSANKKKIYFWFAVTLAVLVLFGNDGMRSIISRRIELTKLNKKLEDIETENRDLRIKLYNFENNPAYVEREARKKLGLIQPGEIKYKFVEAE
ncbi:MAG: septum formation initiator family protein [Elusimicrobiota bacterium]|nr:septum formation initiator family protein [Elusimicrobiota bacterium]